MLKSSCHREVTGNQIIEDRTYCHQMKFEILSNCMMEINV